MTRIEGLNQPFSVSCGSLTLCAVMSSQGGALATATNPTGGTAAWTLSRFELGASPVLLRHGHACASPTESYTELTSTAPGGATTFDRSAARGARARVRGRRLLPGHRRHDPRCRPDLEHARRQGAWARADLTQHGVRTLWGVACPSPTRCLAVDEDGRVAHLDHADRPRQGWGEEADLSTVGADALTALACGVSRCVAGDASGGLFERDAAGAWRRTAGETGAVVLGAACAGDALCAVADEAGDVRRSDGTGWRTESVARTALNGIACPSVELCVAVGDDGRAYHSHGAGWRRNA